MCVYLLRLDQFGEGRGAIPAFTLYDRSHGSMSDLIPKPGKNRCDMNNVSVRRCHRVGSDVALGDEKWEKAGRKRAETNGPRKAAK
jgi:hypothetical protein